MNGDDPASSTRRFLLAAAPGGLSIVQDLMNTVGTPAPPLPDLLEDVAKARAYLDASLRTWAEHTGRTPPRITITADDLGPLRDLRDDLRARITGESTESARAAAADISFQDGLVAYTPSGNGAAAVTSLVLLEALLAAHAGVLARLKICPNPGCGAAFYDQSRNSTRVWHDMKTCGNVANLRASRARRRLASG